MGPKNGASGRKALHSTTTTAKAMRRKLGGGKPDIPRMPTFNLCTIRTPLHLGRGRHIWHRRSCSNRAMCPVCGKWRVGSKNARRGYGALRSSTTEAKMPRKMEGGKRYIPQMPTCNLCTIRTPLHQYRGGHIWHRRSCSNRAMCPV